MNYTFFIKLLLILTIIITVCICGIKPQMHTVLIVTDSNYNFSQQNISSDENKKNEIITTLNQQEMQRPETFTKNETITIKSEPKTIKNKSSKSTNNKIITAFNTNKSKQTSPQTKTAVKNTSTTIKPQKTQNKTTVQKNILTTQQEEIVWNIWRSNLQNKIIQDLKLPIIPKGVVFKFTFTVDKYGKVTNVKTWSLNPTYTPYAIQYIAPIIRSYQGHSILDFPPGSARVITDVAGGFKISDTLTYSSPNDYNDIETVKK